MRILSPFKDYYDTASSYGVDTSLVYVRKMENSFTDKWVLPHESRRGGKNYCIGHIRYFVIGFCGEYFPMVRVSVTSYDNFGEVHYCYSYEELKAVQDKFGFSERHSFFQFRSDAEFFLYYTNVADDTNFVEYNTPIFLVEYASYADKQPCLTVNPRLESIGFARIKDPVTAFQEVSMYLGNQLVKEKEVIQIADKHKITGHGFDLKTSFRHPIK